MSNALDQLLQEAAGVAGSYLTNGITVEVKTNYTPALTVYTGSNGPSSSGAPGSSSGGNLFSQLIGMQAGVRVLAADGHVLASYGDWPATDWVRVAAALAVIGLLGFGLVKLIRAV